MSLQLGKGGPGVSRATQRAHAKSTSLSIARNVKAHSQRDVHVHSIKSEGSSPIPGRTAGAAHTTTASSAGFSVSGTKLSANLPPNTPANTSIPVASGAHTVDSNAYLRDVVNLSVDLDHDPSPPAAAEAASDLLMATSSSGEDEGEAQAGGKSECTALRASARALLTNLDPAAHIGERVHWMLVTAPDAPVAGEECALLFNRKQSDALRDRPRVQLLYGFNSWELTAGEGALFTADLAPAPLPRGDSDWWWVHIKIPENTYEINFVLSDGGGAFENNGGKDFMYPVVGGITKERWAELAEEMALRREEERAAAARRAEEEAEQARQAALRAEDAEKGKRAADELLSNYKRFQDMGVTVMTRDHHDASPLLWVVDPPSPAAGSTVTLYFNRHASHALHWVQRAEEKAVTLRWGINGWKGARVVDMQRMLPPAPAAAGSRAPARSHAAITSTLFASDPEGEWWQAELELPFEAAVVNFVVNLYDQYDNNEGKDHALRVGLPQGVSAEQWGAQLAEVFSRREFEARIAAEEAARAKELRRQEKRRQAREVVKAVERRKVRHVLHTEPEIVTAGGEVTLWYNPRDTPLNGKPQIYLTAGWNRWTHKTPIGPLAMTPPDTPPVLDQGGREVAPGEVRSGSPTHWKATFKVPRDAYKMDFVFSDVPGGEGTYDNRGGYDYHLPVEGSRGKEAQLYVAHIAVEMAPIAKVGGLGDVVTALGRAVQDQGHLVEVLLPKYEFFNSSPVLNGQLKYETEFDWGGTRVFVTTATVENLRVWFIEPRNGFFNTQSVYGRYDDEVRFDFFCKAALEFLLRTGRQPDILHCHDWSTAHVAKAYWDDYHPYGLWKPKVVFTIHNLNYGQKKIGEANFYSQRFTTVSPTYAFETGGHAVVAPHAAKFCGIRNGIDPDLWDPETCPWLPLGYTSDNVDEGKRAARLKLRQSLGLTDWGDKFIVAVVSRLTGQKGVPLIKHTAFRTTERGGQFVLLGSAPDPKVQAEFNDLAARMNGADACFCFKYDEPLSHLIYAAADMVVVPSMFEPCGLTQMIAMRYGAVPVVRHTGGLKDTVYDVDFDKARAAWEMYGSADWQRDGVDATNGFAFEGADPGALDYALNRAIDAWYNDRAWFRGLQKRVMDQDWSWNRPALDYIELYFAAKK